MKTKLTFIIFTLFFTFLCNAQTVYLYTPNGSQVYAFQQEEMSVSDITYYTNLCANTYPQATVLANASNTYNCHSYAWNIKEGGSTCWLNQSPDLHKYWDDGSYIETTASNAEKIFYYNGDHSAVKSNTHSGKYESKWGSLSLMRHSPEYGPSDYNMQYRRYYKKNPPTISGASQMCGNTSATFTVTNPPASYTWATCGNLQAGAESGNSKTFTAIGGGSSCVRILVGNTEVARHNVFVGEPVTPYVYSTERTHYNGTYTFTAANTGTYTPYTCYWRISTSPDLSLSTQFTSSFPQGSYAFANASSTPATYYVAVTLNTSCGLSKESLPQKFTVQTGHLEIPIIYSAAYPNPAGNELIIDKIEEENSTETAAINTQSIKGKTSEIRVLLYNNSTAQLVYNKTYSSSEKQIKIDTSKLPNGIYHLNIIENGEKIKEQTIVVNH